MAIGHDVWVGHGAIILPGRTIGTGAVVAAAQWSRRTSLPTPSLRAIRPCVIRQRFPAAVVERLLRLAWWNWTHDELRAALPDFRRESVEGFLDKYEPAVAHA